MAVAAVEKKQDVGAPEAPALAGVHVLPTRLRVCVAVRDDGFNGIETYAEQVAIAAARAGHEVTLLVTSPQVEQAVKGRTSGIPLRIVNVGLSPLTEAENLRERLVPQLHTWRVGKAMAATLHHEPRFDVVHLNRPALASWVDPRNGRLFVAGWFYPHAPVARLFEAWRHTRGQLARRVVLALKSLAYHAGDARGYRAPAVVVACTETLAAQLRDQGLRAAACPPPVQDVADLPDAPAEDGELNLLVCSGDLSHPRKNLADAVRAAGLLARSGRRVVLRAIGRQDERLRHAAKNLPDGARLEVLGPKPPQEVRAEMRRAHVFVLPSLYEEWGYVAVEAILSGTPVATYPVYPFHDMLAGGLGVVADRISPEALTHAIEAALRCPRGAELAEIGRARFGAEAIGTRLTQIWTGADTQGRALFASAL